MNFSLLARKGLGSALCGLLLVTGMLVLTGTGAAASSVIPKQLLNPAVPDGNAACMECHSKQETMVRNGKEISVQVDGQLYHQSAHGIISCVRCHTEAGPEHAKDPKAPLNVAVGRERLAEVSQGCVKCHAGVYQHSYDQSFHGIAIRHGDNRAATCVDCHGTHNVLPSREPESMVSRQNLTQTCSTGGCHPGASEKIADGKEHFIMSKKETAGSLHLVYKFFIGLILFDTLKDGPIVMFELLRRLKG